VAVVQSSYSTRSYAVEAAPLKARPATAIPHAVPGGATRRRPRAGSRVSFVPFIRPTLAAAVLAVALIVYVSGHERMTAAGYQRVKLQAVESNLRAEQNLLQTIKNEQGKKDRIVAWAEAHGFVKPSVPPLTIASIPHNNVRERR